MRGLPTSARSQSACATVKGTNTSLTTLGNVVLSGGTMTADGGLNFGGSYIGTFQLNGSVTVSGKLSLLHERYWGGQLPLLA